MPRMEPQCEEGFGFALDDRFDAAIVRSDAAGRDGLGLIRELRERKHKVPIIILSAKSDVEDRVKDFRPGRTTT